MEVYQGDELENPGSTPLTRKRPEVSEEAEEIADAFFNLMNLRSGELISSGDIAHYLDLFPRPPYLEWFPRLILGMQRAYFAAKREAEVKRSKLTHRLQDSIKER
jgi:hypothetical protein